MTDRDEEPATGRIIAEKYRLTRLIGQGGMGSVWEGEHISLGTKVAVKFIEPSFIEHEEVKARFLNEAKAAATLQSKHIVQVFDHGTDAQGRPYIVMELLKGEPLDARLEREGTLELAEVQQIILQASKALRKAHAAGIVHRDLKPDNVFLCWDEEDKKDLVKIVDFGIAKFTDRSNIPAETRTGAVLGTPHFMSPEQARGLKSVDARTDIWSLGVIAYRCVTGRLPFDGEAVGDLLVRLCTQETVPPSQHVPLPAEFDAWVKKSLSKQPDGRFASVEEQAKALCAINAPEPSRGPKVSIVDTQTGVAAHSKTALGDTQAGLVHSGHTPAHNAGRSWWLWALPVALVGIVFLVVRSTGSADLPQQEVTPSAHAAAAVPSQEQPAEVLSVESEVAEAAPEAEDEGVGGSSPAEVSTAQAEAAPASATVRPPQVPKANARTRTSKPVVRVKKKRKSTSSAKIADELGY